MSRSIEQPARILLTGAGGFIGHHVLAEILRRGRPCAALLRPPLEPSLVRLGRLLGALDVALEEHLERGTLVALAGDLTADLPAPGSEAIGSVIHAAASTRFDADGCGDPVRTNVDGTRRLLQWCDAWGVRHFHLVSSAYVCGRAWTTVPERVRLSPPDFHNQYERSKWLAEQMCLEWAARRRRSLTIMRPSIVVGAWATGRATRFSGFYLAARAADVVARMADRAGRARGEIGLRVRGRAGDHQNIVPVDYVAAMIAGIAADGGPLALHDRTYHLVNPDPPGNGLIGEAVEACFGLRATEFVAPERWPLEDLDEYERRFCDVSRAIEHYFVDTPLFACAHAGRAAQALGLHCPRFECDDLVRMIRYARGAAWGRVEAPAAPPAAADAELAEYFETFLPQRVARSRVAQIAALSAVVRFVIEDEPDGHWVCRFAGGGLDWVRRGRNGVKEDFAFHTSRAVFRRVVAGQADARAAFFAGQAEITGDVEQALKMAVVLDAFMQEFPYRGSAAAIEDDRDVAA